MSKVTNCEWSISTILSDNFKLENFQPFNMLTQSAFAKYVFDYKQNEPVTQN